MWTCPTLRFPSAPAETLLDSSRSPPFKPSSSSLVTTPPKNSTNGLSPKWPAARKSDVYWNADGPDRPASAEPALPGRHDFQPPFIQPPGVHRHNVCHAQDPIALDRLCDQSRKRRSRRLGIISDGEVVL